MEEKIKMSNDTLFKEKCKVLAYLWVGSRHDEQFAQIFAIHDLGFPLAFCISDGIIGSVSSKAREVVEETYDALIKEFGKEITEVKDA